MTTKLDSRWLNVSDDLDVSSNKLTNVTPGTDPTDGVNVSQLNAAVEGSNELTDLHFGATSNDTIDPGAVSIDTTSNAADVVEELNVVLGSLVPDAAPDLDQLSRAISGASGKLSFGTSGTIAGYTNHPSIDINGSYSQSGNNGGIINATQNLNGVLNDDVAAHAYAYPANAFGNGDKGTLSMYVNGVPVHSYDLSVLSGGLTLNGNGTGFNLGAATSVSFASGATFEARKYRTGTWTVNNADLRNGYNTVQVRHSEGGLVTNIFTYIVDASTTTTAYSGAALSALSMSGSNPISGIVFHTSGDADYGITISNLHTDTYSSSSSAISHPTTTNCGVSSSALGTISDETDTEVITGKTVTVDTGRILPSGYQGGLGNTIGVSTRTDRTIQTDVVSSTTTAYNLLLDSNTGNSTDVSHTFRGELRRLLATSDFSDDTLSANYTPASSLLTLTDELQCYNDRLVYPSYDFSGVVDGATNPDYSTASGDRYYYGYFTNGTGTANFRFSIGGSGLTLVPVASFSNASTHVTMEMRLPGETGWLDCMKAFETGKWTDGDGCYSAALGSDISIPTTNLGITIGTKNTANANNRMYFRIKIASSATSGYLSGVSIIWNAS